MFSNFKVGQNEEILKHEKMFFHPTSINIPKELRILSELHSISVQLSTIRSLLCPGILCKSKSKLIFNNAISNEFWVEFAILEQRFNSVDNTHDFMGI